MVAQRAQPRRNHSRQQIAVDTWACRVPLISHISSIRVLCANTEPTGKENEARMNHDGLSRGRTVLNSVMVQGCVQTFRSAPALSLANTTRLPSLRARGVLADITTATPQCVLRSSPSRLTQMVALLRQSRQGSSRRLNETRAAITSNPCFSLRRVGCDLQGANTVGRDKHDHRQESWLGLGELPCQCRMQLLMVMGMCQ
jgi:hypothetical protein